jgi:hypothetical protein
MPKPHPQPEPETWGPTVAEDRPASAAPSPPPDPAVVEAQDAIWKLLEAGHASDGAPAEAWARPAAVLVDALERSGDQRLRASLADHLADAQLRRPLPDALARRLFRVARAHVPTCPRPTRLGERDECEPGWPWYERGIDVNLARLAVALDVERLGLAAELGELVASHPDTPFQRVLLEEMRFLHAASRERVEILAGQIRQGAPKVQRWALKGITEPRPLALPKETCAAVASGMQSTSPGVAVDAAVRAVGLSPCAAERALALDDLEARAARGDLPDESIPGLCAFDLRGRDLLRPRALLRALALSPTQPRAVRHSAMFGVHWCLRDEWPGLYAVLLRDPDEGVRQDAASVDRFAGVNWDP